MEDKIKLYFYNLSRGNGKDTHTYVLETETKTIRGEAVALVAEKLATKGFNRSNCGASWLGKVIPERYLEKYSATSLR